MKTVTTDGEKALAATTCTCKDKIFGVACTIDCSDDKKFKGDGINADKKCNCLKDTFYDSGASVCAATCKEITNTSPKTDKTGCECSTGYLGDAKTGCKKCDTAKAAANCLCKATHSGDDCGTEKKADDANAFI